MVDLWMEEIDGSCFAAAFQGERLVATAVAVSREQAAADIRRYLPRGAEPNELRSAGSFAQELVHMLAELESGEEGNKRFELSEEYLPPFARRTYTVAAAIPIGYVATYGEIGTIAGVIPRRVGHLMATNPLYPIVPCHRVVGSDMALVGYGGRQDARALRSKLVRLRAEVRGRSAGEIAVLGDRLPLYPVERVVDHAAGTRADPVRQLMLFG